MSLDEALKIVKLAGYRVTKSGAKKRKLNRKGPTCAYQEMKVCGLRRALQLVALERAELKGETGDWYRAMRRALSLIEDRIRKEIAIESATT